MTRNRRFGLAASSGDLWPTGDVRVDTPRTSTGAWRRRETPAVAKTRAWSAWVGLIAFCLAVLLCCEGCAFIRLKRELESIEQGLASLQGEVVTTSTKREPVVVALWAAGDLDHTILRHWFMHGAGAFRFVVRAPGSYRLMAFEDLNGDLVYQRDEPAATCRTPSTIHVSPGQQLEGLRIALEQSERPAVDFEVNLSSSAELVSIDDITVSVGEVTSIDDPRFTQEKGSLGSWEPLRFLREVGGGVCFLEEYDSSKTPVLFIHGVAGHPGHWKSMVERLDRRYFQPWVFFYASGGRLQTVSEALYRIAEVLRARHGFSELHLVAHSMGGLVSRGFLDEVFKRESPLKIPVFMTISTPWGGHAAAEMGVKRAPAVIPSWRDIAPGSAFQTSLWERPLPPETRYILVFSFRGRNAPFLDRNNDGSVALASALDLKAQMAASHVYGLNEDHVSILSCPEVSDLLGDALDKWRSHR